MNGIEALIHLARHVETNLEANVIRYTDSVVGLSHRITANEIASGIREMAGSGNVPNTATRPLYDLLVARSDGDVVVPSEIGEILDAIALYIAVCDRDAPEAFSSFEMAVLRICGNPGRDP